MTFPLIRRLTLIAVFAVLLMWSCPPALAQATQPVTTQPAQPLSIARQGYFFVGGHLFPVNGDQAMAGQMFVQYQVPAGTTKPYPVVMVHGGGQTGTNFLGTPDGRPGWNEWFLRQGYSVYIVDQPARGRSAYYPAVQGSTAPSLAHGTEQRFTAPEKYNLWPQAKLHTQWPGSGNQGDPIFDQFFASQETSITNNVLMDESNRDDLVALLERIGPAIVLTHSRSGPFGWLVADARPDLVRAILAIEPNGPPFFDVVPSAVTPTFVRAWGIAYAKLHFDPSVEQPASLAPGLDASDDGPDMERCWLPTGAKRTLPGLQRMPILILSSEASYHARYDQCTVRFLMQNGVQPDFVRLADIGIHGNGHMMMIEKNNEQVAKVLIDWLDQRVH
jgi:pimeloyl-ACP methyl ester carboxylesterase